MNTEMTPSTEIARGAPIDRDMVDRALVSLRRRMAAYVDDVPSVWRELDDARVHRGSGPSQRTTPWCLLPTDAADDVAHRSARQVAERDADDDPGLWWPRRRGHLLDVDDAQADAARLRWIERRVAGVDEPDTGMRLRADVASLYTWRAGQGVYVFDADLVDALKRTRFNDRIPTEA